MGRGTRLAFGLVSAIGKALSALKVGFLNHYFLSTNIALK